ncbi:MAG: HAMP domain-containing histidine kinase, partial [Clostridia bacterium]|nr:HAMP domain-containing histidine kinase [Clostridia bacterium]
FNSNGEHIMSVAMVFPMPDGNFNGAVRFVTSLTAIDAHIYAFVGIVFLIYLIALSFVTFSGAFFVRTIVAPVRKINDATKSFTQGNIDARIELQGYEKDEINELAESVNNMLNEVSATDKIKNDFISTVSHELRTPLTAIKGWGEMLRELGPDDIELAKRGTDIIISESERLSQLVEELLNFSRLQNGTLSLRLEKIDVLAELDETIFVFKERSKRDGIELTYSAPDLPAPMMADPNRIKQVFVNVLDNAFKYTEQGGMVSVEAFIDGDRLIIQVLDTGCGIAQEDLPNVKMKFYKANIQVRGSGIGLAVVDELVKMHNGILDIQSKLGIGTTVTIILPIEEVKVDENINLFNDIIGEDLSDV